MSDFENFKTMLSHGFPSNKVFTTKENMGERNEKVIEKKRIYLSGLQENISYEQFIFDENGEFITWQSMKWSMTEEFI